MQPDDAPEWLRVEVLGGTPARQRRLRPQGRETLERLTHAGLEVFADIGYHDARVDDIAERAGTSHGTFYRYFGDKGDLLESLCATALAESEALAERAPELAGDDRAGELEDWIGEVCRWFARNRPILRACRARDHGATHDGTAADALVEPLRATLTERLDERDDGAFDTEATARAVIAMVEELVRMRSEPGQAASTAGALVRRCVL